MDPDQLIAQWVFTSFAKYLKDVAAQFPGVPVHVEHFDERDSDFMQARNRVEVRINGPESRQLHGERRLDVTANVQVTSYMSARPLDIQKIVGLYEAAMGQPIPIYKYGDGPQRPDDPVETQYDFIGCFIVQNPVRIGHFGQIDKTDKVKQSGIDAKYRMYLSNDTFDQ